MRWILIVALLAIAGVPAALFLASTETQIELRPEVKAVGPEPSIAVWTANPHGVRRVTVELVQGANSVKAGAEKPATRFLFWRTKAEPAATPVKLPNLPKAGFQSGAAQLKVTAVSNDLRGKETLRAYEVKVNLAPPVLSVADGQHYINQGGAELVAFTVSGYWTEAGVRVGDFRFRSFRMPGAADESNRFSLFAFPWGVPAKTEPLVYARNDAGQEVTARFWHKTTPKKFRKRELELTEAFIQKAIGEVETGGNGNALDRFLRINGEVRRANNKALADLRMNTEERMLWKPPFLQLGNSKVEAFFADVRSYMYEKKKVDEQVHLGFDLSVTKNVPVEAANDGKVVFADRLGIYGNCIVIDHGYGLQSIYGHLSSIDVKPGQAVTKRQVIGKSGSTGLAGGDHLHYSMQVDGVQVNPVEWWDAHWIQDRILSKLPGN